jgi:hypothetical protein
MKSYARGLILPLLLFGQACSTSPTMPASNDATATANSVAILTRSSTALSAVATQ